MKLSFKEPNPNGYMPLVLAMAQRDKSVPIAGAFDAQDPISVRLAYEHAYSGPSNGPTGGYFEMLLFFSNVEGRLNYKPRALTGDEGFEKIIKTYWEARCRNGVVSGGSVSATETDATVDADIERAPSRAC